MTCLDFRPGTGTFDYIFLQCTVCYPHPQLISHFHRIPCQHSPSHPTFSPSSSQFPFARNGLPQINLPPYSTTPKTFPMSFTSVLCPYAPSPATPGSRRNQVCKSQFLLHLQSVDDKLFYRSQCCPWMCLSYSILCCPWKCLFLQHLVLSGRFCYATSCAV